MALTVNIIPKGAVLAFADAPTGNTKVNCDSLEGGWIDFLDSEGRFILGAGNKDEIEYKTGNDGGEKEVILTVEQMPSHNHDY